MPLRQSTLDALRKLSATLPPQASTLDLVDLVAKTRWPAGEYRPKPASSWWKGPLVFEFAGPHSGNVDHPWFEDPDLDESIEQIPPYWQIGSTKHLELLVRGDAPASADPMIVFYDPEEDVREALTLPFSALVASLEFAPSSKPDRPALAPMTPALERLVQSIERPDPSALRAAIADGANPNDLFERRETVVSPLTLALRGPCRKGTARVVTALLDAGADPTRATVIDTIVTRKGEGTDDFHAALGELFARGVRIPASHPEGGQPVKWAEARSLALMLEHGLDANATLLENGMLLSSLCEAVWHGGFERAELLVEHGADVNFVVASHDVTPLHFAVGAPEAMRLVPFLLEHGARPHRSRGIPRALLPPKLRTRAVDTDRFDPRELALCIERPDVAALVPES